MRWASTRPKCCAPESGPGPMSDPTLIIATHHRSKLGELRTIVAQHVADLTESDVISDAELDLPDVIEDGVTFAENAVLKARAVAEATGVAAVADDSGLAVDILGGAPGIFSEIGRAHV